MVEISVTAEISDKKKVLVAGHDRVFSILFSEFSLPVTFFWYCRLICNKKLVKPK
jgi:hypothetical protein